MEGEVEEAAVGVVVLEAGEVAVDVVSKGVELEVDV